MSQPWYPMFWRDHVAETAHLSLQQQGAYVLLQGHYYVTGRPLPANADVLHRVCRCTSDAERAAVEEVLAMFFVRDGEVHRHQRIDERLAEAEDKSTKRRAAANARHQKGRASAGVGAPANAVQMQVHLQPQPQPQPQEKSKAGPPGGAPPQRRSQMPADFQPKTIHQQLAAELGVSLEAAFAAFCDFHGSKGSVFKDWDLALNSWLRKERRFANGNGHSSANRAERDEQQSHDAISGAAERFTARRAASEADGLGAGSVAKTVTD